jgi:hypothetical protein
VVPIIQRKLLPSVIGGTSLLLANIVVGGQIISKSDRFENLHINCRIITD